MTRDEYNKAMKARSTTNSYSRDNGYQGSINFEYKPSEWVQGVKEYLMPLKDVFQTSMDDRYAKRAIEMTNIQDKTGWLNAYWEKNGEIPDDKLGELNARRNKLGYDSIPKEVLEIAFAKKAKGDPNIGKETVVADNTATNTGGSGYNTGYGDGTGEVPGGSTTTNGSEEGGKTPVIQNPNNQKKTPVAVEPSWLRDTFALDSIIDKYKGLNDWYREKSDSGDASFGDWLYRTGGNAVNIAGILTSGAGQPIGKELYGAKEIISNWFRSKNAAQGVFKGTDGKLWQVRDGKVTPVERDASGKLVIRSLGGK